MRKLILLFFTAILVYANCESCKQYNSPDSAKQVTIQESYSDSGEVIYKVEKKCCNKQKCCRNDYYKLTFAKSGTYTFDFDVSNDENDKILLRIATSCNKANGNADIYKGTVTSHASFKKNFNKNQTVCMRLIAKKNEERVDYNFLIKREKIAPYSTPQLQLCSLYGSGIVALNSVFANGMNVTQCGSDTILTQRITNPATGIFCSKKSSCDGLAPCSKRTPPDTTLTLNFLTSSKLNDIPSGSSIDLSETDYKNTTISTSATINFKPTYQYNDSDRKIMTLGVLNLDNAIGSFTLNFAPGDYYFDSIEIKAGNLVINLPQNGVVRIFIKNNFDILSQNFSINESGNSKHLLFFVGNDITLKKDGGIQSNIKAYFYTKGNIHLGKVNPITGSLDIYGGLFSEQMISFNAGNIHIHYEGPLGSCGYCARHNSEKGFHLINPFNDVNKKFEIFCTDDKPSRTLIALPIKDKFNNFLYTKDELDSTDYYKEANNSSTGFHAIEVDIDEINKKIIVQTGKQIEPLAKDNYKIMRKGFSNINLIGTPFRIDWAHTQITHCDPSKLRKAYYGQAVKINTLDYTNARCYIDHMELKLLDDYRYLYDTFHHREALYKSCKEMAEGVALDILPKHFRGHFWISPLQHKRDFNNTDILSAPQRPFVVYCWYQDDLNYAWTFFLALDGKRTITKYDLVKKKDTCSRFGLWPFVPNTKKSFERVRKFLLNNKPQWENYTGTIDEKLSALYGNHYYLAKERNSLIWPYGSFGLYYDDGDSNHHETSFKWGGEDVGTDPHHPGPMAGSPMHNLPYITNDYNYTEDDEGDPKRDYYGWSRSHYSLSSSRLRYSLTDKGAGDDKYTYSDTMGAKGWTTILGHNDLNKTDEWFISRTGAGLNFDRSDDDWPYYEPNGNYEEGCWLNFLYDSQGHVRHLDDWGCNYPYYDYMCMAEDNYDFVHRYHLIKGPFDVIDHNVPEDEEISKKFLTTKIVNAPIDVDIIILDDELKNLQSDRNLSAGLFLCKIVKVNGNEIAQDVHFFGELKKNGQLDSSKKREELPASLWPQGVNKWPKTSRKMLFKFKYCKRSDWTWDKCWETGLNGKCKDKTYCAYADSDYFAIRPMKFSFSVPNGNKVKAGNPVDLSFQALAYDGTPTYGYNEIQNSSFTLDITIDDPTKTCKKNKIEISPDINFTNGVDNRTDFQFPDVGVFRVILKEKKGEEFAKIDSNDTQDSQRLIQEYNSTITIIPDHFLVLSTIHNFNNASFTYIAKNPQLMSMIMEANITAKTKNGATTYNYSKSCYAKDTTFAISHSQIPSSLTTIISYEESNASKLIQTAQNSPIEQSFSKNIFTPDDNGSAHLRFHINFDRSVSQAVNPFTFTITKNIIKDTDDVNGTNQPNQSAQFYYGRIHAADESVNKFRGNNAKVNLYYEVYDPNHSDPAGIEGDASIDDLGWFVNSSHTQASFGKVQKILYKNHDILNSSSAPFSMGTLGGYDHGVQQLLFSYDGSKEYPFKARFDINASSWLIYDPYSSSATTTSFTVLFTNPGIWQGVGSFKQTNEINSSEEEERRINW